MTYVRVGVPGGACGRGGPGWGGLRERVVESKLGAVEALLGFSALMYYHTKQLDEVYFHEQFCK